MTSRKLAKIAIKKDAAQKITELSPLISLLKKRKLRTVVEIGTEKGGTLYAWCRVAFGTWYVRNWNLRLDIVILFKTIMIVIKKEGAL